MANDKTYLGDGAYVEIINDYEVVLTTENGIDTTNRVVLEPEVLFSFLDYLQKAGVIKWSRWSA